jgi:WD40 repeat protein
MRISGFLLGSGSTVTTPRFFAGGRVLAAGSRDGWLRLWSPATSRPVSPRLAAHRGPVASLAVSPDGRTLASGGTDGTVRLFDLATHQPLSARLAVAPGTPVTVLFSPDGAYLFAFTSSGRGYRVDFRPSAWARRACSVAGRRLTRAEWTQLLPGRPYQPAC